eukprot:6175215-Pleurochrysis_carterae.AAC.6
MLVSSAGSGPPSLIYSGNTALSTGSLRRPKNATHVTVPVQCIHPRRVELFKTPGYGLLIL